MENVHFSPQTTDSNLRETSAYWPVSQCPQLAEENRKKTSTTSGMMTGRNNFNQNKDPGMQIRCFIKMQPIMFCAEQSVFMHLLSGLFNLLYLINLIQKQ